MILILIHCKYKSTWRCELYIILPSSQIQSTMMNTVHRASYYLVMKGLIQFYSLEVGTISIYIDFISVSTLVSIEASTVQKNRIWRALQIFLVELRTNTFYFFKYCPV